MVSNRDKDTAFFGHPIGLATLFFTELWERFSYYGMRALLMLFMTATVANGGFEMSESTASAIYGLYTAGVYMVCLPGGWIADRLLSPRISVMVGGMIIALGHFVLAIPGFTAFYLGLVLVVVGTGFLKPNISAIVADLYPEGGARRDAGFSIFYMGINIGAFAGPIVCGYLGEGIDCYRDGELSNFVERLVCENLGNNVGWHLGFAAAGVGMLIGQIIYIYGFRFLGDAGQLREAGDRRRNWRALGIGVAALLAISGTIAGLRVTEVLTFDLVQFAQGMGVVIAVIAVLYFVSVIFFGGLTPIEKRRVGLIAVFFVAAAVFWAGFEQAGSSMNLFAKDLTDRSIAGWEMPASWLQSINPIFIILLAPVIGSLWVRLGARNPSIGVKFAMGLVLLGAGFLVLAWGASYTSEHDKVSPMWLVVTYFFHTVGELCLSPVGLSSTTKLAPKRLVSQMMGMWFMGSALGNLIAGLLAGYIETLPMSQLYLVVASITGGFGALLFLLIRPMRYLAAGVK